MLQQQLTHIVEYKMRKEPTFELQSACPEIGMRAWYLEQARLLEGDLGFSTSNFIAIPPHVISSVVSDSELPSASAIKLIDENDVLGKRSVHPELIEFYADRLRPIIPALETWTSSLEGDRIIVRPSPLDEHTYGNLSFAGVYKSYMPGNVLDRATNLLIGTASVLAGRYTKYGNCYYDRHGIESDRSVGIMYMQPFFDPSKESPLFHGTAYVTDGHMRNEYVIAPPADQPQREPKLMTKRKGQITLTADDLSVENSVNFVDRMDRLLDGLQNHFKAPLDVEYLMDTQGNMYVVQIRRISEKHLNNWSRIPIDSSENIAYGSAIVNTVGTVEGQLIDLRQSTEAVDLRQVNGSVLLINHEDNGSGMHVQALLDTMRTQRPVGMKIVVDHGEARIRDHLQYALVEDPGVEFVLQTSDPHLLSQIATRTSVCIKSDGLSGEVV